MVAAAGAQQVQAVSAETRAAVERIFDGVAEAAYQHIWTGCQANLAMDAQVTEALPTNSARVRAVYERVIERAQQIRAPLPTLSLETLDPARLAELSRAETLYKFFAGFAPVIGLSAYQFLSTLNGDLFMRADAIERWMSEHQVQLAQIKRLDLMYLQLTSLPPQIRFFTGLEDLNLSGNQLTSLPVEIGHCTALKWLDLNNNQLTTLPAAIGQCTALKLLFLHDNQLTTLPTELGQCTALQDLWLQDNQLTTLPPQLGQCVALRDLSLVNNRLTILPPELGRCTTLVYLKLGRNRLTALPVELGQCTALVSLSLRHNQLTTIPAWLRQCTQLIELDFRHNQIEQTREEILQLLPPGFNADELLRLDGNPLRPPPGFWERLWTQITTTLSWIWAQITERLTHLWQSLANCLRRQIRQ